MQQLIDEGRRILREAEGESPEQYRMRTGKCPPGTRWDDTAKKCGQADASPAQQAKPGGAGDWSTPSDQTDIEALKKSIEQQKAEIKRLMDKNINVADEILDLKDDQERLKLALAAQGK